MAEVYLAKTLGLAGFEKLVAIKLIHPNFSLDEQFIEMLINEAKLTVQLQHVNIAQTFDLGRVGDTYYLTMEFVEGADLYQLLRRSSELGIAMPISAAAHVAHEIAVGLDYAHRKRDRKGNHLGIVHRDISPQNVLISRAGEVKLVDFGIAKASQRAQETQVGVIKGKYYYMSPEQAWGDRVDARTDIFSTGIVLYEMLAGQMLYYEEDLHKLLDRVRKADIALPSNLRDGIPTELERITMQALRKRPEDRYQTAGALSKDLQRFLNTYSKNHSASDLTEWAMQIFTSLQADSSISETGAVSGVPAVSKGELKDDNSLIVDVGSGNRPAPLGGAHPVLAPRPGSHSGARAPATPAPLTRPGSHSGQRPINTRVAGPDDQTLNPDDISAENPHREPSTGEATVPLSRPEVLAAAEKIRRRVEQAEKLRPPEQTRTVPVNLGSASTQLAAIEERTVITPAPWFNGPDPAFDPLDMTTVDQPASHPAWPAVPVGTANGLQVDIVSAHQADGTAPPVELGRPHEVEPSPMPPMAPVPETTPAPTALYDFQQQSIEPTGQVSPLDLRKKSKWWLWTALAAAVIGLVLYAQKAPTPAPRSTFTLEILSSPAGATVFVNGIKLPAPTPTNLPEAEHGKEYKLELTAPGYAPETRIVKDHNRQFVMMKRNLVQLNVTSDPPGATVYLNQQPQGQTPFSKSDIDPSGTTTLELRLKGHRPVYEELTWTLDERSKDLLFTLKR